MESAVDALKIVLGIFVFIIGLTMLFNMASQARETASILISGINRNKYFDYFDDANEEKIDKNGNRIVKIQDIVPAIYRYSKENFGITIVDKNGNIVSRFDLDTEIACNSWLSMDSYNKYKFITETNKVYRAVNSLANKIGKQQIKLININTNPSNPTEDDIVDIRSEEMSDLFKKIYGQTVSNTSRREFYCSWIGTDGWTSKRIDSDLSRNRCNI